MNTAGGIFFGMDTAANGQQHSKKKKKKKKKEKSLKHMNGITYLFALRFLVADRLNVACRVVGQSVH